jgi:DNA repair protein RecO (recombination protein O)
MPGLYKDEGVVLRTIKLGEADRILTLYTAHGGKIRAVAKGVRKTKSRFGGRLEPFSRLDLMLYRGRNLDTITAAHLLDSHKEARSDLRRLSAAAALCELVDKITPDDESSRTVYDLLVGGLDAASRGACDTVVPAFAIKLLSISGFHPQLNICAGCGAGGDLGAFSAALGGVLCRDCWSQDEGAWRLSPRGLVLLAELLASEFGRPAEPAVVQEATDSLRRYAEYHLERPLKSLSLLTV